MGICIQNLLELRCSESQIANKIDFSKTAIINEIHRNSVHNCYSAQTAHNLSRRTSSNSKLTDKVKDLIISLLKKKISPILICGKLKYEGIVNICFKAIYNFRAPLKTTF